MGEKLNKLFEEHMGLAVKLGKEYALSQKATQHTDECVQSAMEGLWVACLKFDPSKNIKFSSFAYPFCFGYARHALINFTRNERRNLDRNNLNIIMLSGNTRVGKDKSTEAMMLFSDVKQEDSIDSIHATSDFDMFKNKYLNKRELEVTNLLLEGFAQNEIAVMMDVSNTIISRVVKRIREKFYMWDKGEI